MNNKKVLVVKPILEKENIKLDFSIDSFVDYNDMRGFVDGPIEHLAISLIIDGISYDIFLNEEGKFIDGLLPSIVLLNSVEIYDVVLGNFFVSKSNDEGESVDLSNEELEKISSFINNNIDSFSYSLNKEFINCRILKLSY